MALVWHVWDGAAGRVKAPVAGWLTGAWSLLLLRLLLSKDAVDVRLGDAEEGGDGAGQHALCCVLDDEAGDVDVVGDSAYEAGAHDVEVGGDLCGEFVALVEQGEKLVVGAGE